MESLKNRLAILDRMTSTRRFLLSVVLGTIVFIALFTAAPLNPFHVNWMYAREGDSFQHQIGWLAFKNQPFSIQIGEIPNYPYPGGTSIVYTDSIPILAVFFKAIAHFLPADFQYFGGFLLLCWILQIFFGLEILNQLKVSRPVQVMGGIFLALSPVLMNRAFFHDALCAQWLILAGFLLWIRQSHGQSTIPHWVGLVILSFWIHAYLFAMVSAMMLAAFITEGARTRRWRSVLLGSGCALAICGLSAWLLGMFTTYQSAPLDILQNYSVNLNTFWNPFKGSSFLRQQGIAFDGQYEGYAYLGMGIIGLWATVLAAGWNTIISFQWTKYRVPIFSIVLLSMIATGFSLSINKSIILSLPLPEFFQSLLSTFRSLGRFIWPLYYGVVLFGILAYDRLGFSRIWLGILILIQVVDVLPLISSKNYIQEDDYRSSLVSTFWKSEATDFEHIVILPSDQIETKSADFSLYAIKNGLTINWAYLARGDYETMNESMQDALIDLNQGNSSPISVYVSWDKEQVEQISITEGDSLYICREKNHWLILSLQSLTSSIRSSLDHCYQ